MRNETILVIEDDALNLKLVESLLQLGRYRILKALDAETGMRLLREHRPDLVLMDIRLPGMDGLHATRVIKQDPELKQIPVIALTAQAMLGDDEEAAAAGCDGYISKPIDTRRFLTTLENFLGQDKQNSRTNSGINPDHKEKILVVDDDPLNVKLLTAKLRSINYDVIEAYGGREGLDKAVAEAPDLLLLDVMMPFIDGFEVTKRLKSDPRTCHIPIILITALDARENKGKGLEAGADDFLNKPVNHVELQSRVRSLLDLKRYRHQVSQKNLLEQQIVPLASEQVRGTEAECLPTVLLVEDNETDAQMIQYYLEKESLELELCTDGETALKRIGKGNVDLILLDILLPDINGFEICQSLKQAEETRDIQILMVTCLGDLESKTKGIELGADDYLVKPIDDKELKARIRSLLEKKYYLDTLAPQHDDATAPMKMEKPQRLTPEFDSLETYEIVESQNICLDKKVSPAATEVQPDQAGMVLDRNTLEQILALENQGSSSNLLEKLIKSYLDNTPELLEQLQKVAHRHNPQGLRETAHRLKSSSANLGAETMARLCNELEVMAQANSTENAIEMASRIKREYEKVKHGLTEVLRTKSGAEL